MPTERKLIYNYRTFCPVGYILEMIVIGAYWNRYDIRENFLVLRRNSIHDLLQE